ncbi:Protein disulfide-isomerase TMX3 [Bienertia sinuspersici]
MDTIREYPQVFLPEECKGIKGYIKSLEPIWNERGVTIMYDGWSGPINMHIINFLVYSVRGTEIGEDKVVQLVTDNEAVIKAGGKRLMEEFPHLYWTACAAHCLDLLLEDIGK